MIDVKYVDLASELEYNPEEKLLIANTRITLMYQRKNIIVQLEFLLTKDDLELRTYGDKKSKIQIINKKEQENIHNMLVLHVHAKGTALNQAYEILKVQFENLSGIKHLG